MDWEKRIYCGNLDRTYAGKSVTLMGWVDAIRDHGRLMFIHLRDVSGIVQAVFDALVNPESRNEADLLHEEYVVRIQGSVALRAKGTENPHLETGDIEVLGEHLEILSLSKALPFQISEKAMVCGEEIKAGPENVDEDLRLHHRYLDLRRPSVQEIFLKRNDIYKATRQYLDDRRFVEVETPFLTKSTPEGARDYLVPSRIHQGKFYALPQSPQLFKQILMMGGLDRYFQITRCFRDEDLRPNRQPEFTQLDLEASFIDEAFIYDMIEELTVRMFAVGGISLPRPFPRMPYEEAMARYGTDKPDLRFDLSFRDVTDLMSQAGYGVFRRVLEQGGLIKGFCVKGQTRALSKNVLQNEYALKIVPELGGRGMTWMKMQDGRFRSNVVQFFSSTELEALAERFEARNGDVILMIADGSGERVHHVLSGLRLHLAEKLRLIPEDRYCPLWVTDFPLFELKEGKLSSQHHPFTMPDRVDFDPENQEETLRLKSRAYDLVVNGEELGGGSIRIHRRDLQEKIFQALALSPEEIASKFGFFLKALEYGAPPHGGLALGMDRMASMILKTPSIRDVIAFPKNRSALCPLSQAPSPAKDAQLRELGLLSAPKSGKQAQELPDQPHEQKAPPLPEGPEKISREEVLHVAKLSRLTLKEDEVAHYRKDLNDILEHVAALGEMDTQDVPPMSHVLAFKNAWREDRPRPSKRAASILSKAPEKEGDYFKVPKILEG